MRRVYTQNSHQSDNFMRNTKSSLITEKDAGRWSITAEDTRSCSSNARVANNGLLRNNFNFYYEDEGDKGK